MLSCGISSAELGWEFGRWGPETMEWLRGAADAVANKDPQVASARHWGKVGLPNAWQTRLSVALQKANAACIFQAGRVRGSVDLGGDTGWEDDIEDLLRDAALGRTSPCRVLLTATR